MDFIVDKIAGGQAVDEDDRNAHYAMAGRLINSGLKYVQKKTFENFTKKKSFLNNNNNQMVTKKTRASTKRRLPRKVYKRGKVYKGTQKTTLKKQVRDLAKKVKSDQAYHTFKFANAQRLDGEIAKIGQATVGTVGVTDLESAMANLRYYDPSDPATLVTANASTGTYSRTIHFSSITSSIKLRANYKVPADVRVYLCVPKQDTDITPLSYYSDGISDQVVSGASDSPMLYPTDIDLLTSAYSVKLLKRKVLKESHEMVVSHTVKNIDYDPAMNDTHNLEYQKKYKNFMFLVRVCGVIGHDTSANEQGLVKTGVDIEVHQVYKIIYDAGVNLNDISYTDSRDATFSNASRICEYGGGGAQIVYAV